MWEEIISFLGNNWISVLSLAIASLSFGLYLKDYHWKSRPNLIVKMDNPLVYDLEVIIGSSGTYISNLSYEETYSPNGFIKNKGGVKTTIAVAKIRKGRNIRFFSNFLKTKEYVIHKAGSWGAFYLTRRIMNGSNKITLGTGDISKINSFGRQDFLELLYKNSLVDCEKEDQEYFHLVVEHVFGKSYSNSFKILLSKKSLEFLKLDCDEKEFIERCSKEKEER